MNQEEDLLISYNPIILETVSLPKVIIKNFTKIGIKANEWQLFSLISLLESEGKVIPPQEELAKMMGLSERQLKQIVFALKNKGLLLVSRNKNSSRYNFNPLLEKAKEIEYELS